MYQTVTRGPMQLPTSLEPWLNAKAKVLSDKVFQIQLDPIWIQIPERTKAGSEQLKGPEHPLHLLLLLLHLLHLLHLLLTLQGLLLLVPVDHREGSREPLLAVQKVFNFDCFASWNMYLADERCLCLSSSILCPLLLIERWRDSWRDSCRSSLITWTKFDHLDNKVDSLDKRSWSSRQNFLSTQKVIHCWN